MNSFKKNITSPWFIRKIVYITVSIVLGLLAAVGIMTPEQSEALGSQLVEVLVTVIGALALSYAGAKTNKASDSMVTNKEYRELQVQVLSPDGYPEPTEDEIQKAVVEEPIESDLPIYDGDTTQE